MEHRWNPRIGTDIKVTLYHHRIPVITTRATNLSKGGVFVRSIAITYPKNTLLDVEFHGQTPQFPQARALVVYGNDTGMGLTFTENAGATSRLVDQLTQTPAAATNPTGGKHSAYERATA